MTDKTVFLFSGQGSQQFQMGRDLYQRLPDFRRRLDRLDALAERDFGLSPLRVLFDPGRNRFDPFDRLLHSNPALFAVQFALADTLIAMGARPDLLMGSSLGELVALAVAEVLPAEEMLRLLIGVARIVEARGAAGGLAAVLAPPSLPDERPDWFAGVEIASVASNRHFVIAGAAAALDAAQRTLTAAGHSCMPLPVRFAFHSRLMEPLLPELAEAFDRIATWATPRIPIFSTLLADDAPRPDAAHCGRLLRQPIRLRDAFQRLEARQTSRLIDLGPSGTMATCAKYTLSPRSGSEILSALPLFGDDWAGFLEVRARLGI